jgi:hypothetical protein
MFQLFNMFQLFSRLSVSVILLAALSGCSSTTAAKDFNGLPTADGQPIGHLSTSNVAVHLLFGKTPIWGNASLEKTVSDFTAAAKSHNASQVNIVQSSQRKWWFIFPPFTFFVTPVTSNVAGEALQ